VERDFSRNGATYVRRTYVSESRTHVSVYRTYYYGGSPYRYYVPAYYYAPTYYRWVYNPWPAPVYYAWGWNTAPWYAPYGYYFSPYPVYPSAAFWLTDYLIAENLRAAYDARAAADETAVAAAQPGQGGGVALSPEVKQLIAEEVKAQLAAEEAAAQNKTAAGAPAVAAPQSESAEQAPPALDPRLRVFVVSTSLDVVNGGEPCSLNPGDVLMRVENTPDDENTVAVNVVSSQNASCSPGTSPRVQIADLQEMHNRFREQIDGGLKVLADNRGQGGLPPGPVASARSNPEGTAAPDLSAAADVQKQQDEAGDAEKDVQKASPGTGAKQ
jgi:hypothetical protein